MGDVVKFLPALIVICGPALFAGWRGNLTLGLIWAAFFLALAIYFTLTEPDNYDMHNFGLKLFGTISGLALVSYAIAALLRRVAGARRAQQP